MIRYVRLFLLPAVTLTSCAPESSQLAEFERFDSAGVSIAVTNAQTSPDSPRARVSADPVFEVGEEAGAPEFLLSGIAGASRLSDGSIVVCNAADRTLRYYAPDGTHVRSAAGQGEGPGELRRISGCQHQGGLTWVYQGPALPIERFNESGERSDPVSIPRPGGRPARLVDIGPDGDLLLQQDAPRRDLPSGVAVLTTSIFRTDLAGAAHLLGTFDGSMWVRSNRVSFPAAFSPSLYVRALGDSTVVSWSATHDMALVRTDGTVDLRIRVTVDPVPVTASHRSSFRTRVLEGPMPGGDVPYQDDDVRREIADMMVYPDALPAHYRVLVSEDMKLWVERGDAPRDPLPQVAEPYGAATTWDIFHTDGEWLGPIELPAGFEPLEIGATYVLGVHHDDVGVERVRMYHLIQPNLGR